MSVGKLNPLSRADEKKVKKIYMKRSTASWTKIRDLRHTLIQYFLQQSRFGTGKDKRIEKEEDERRFSRDLPLLTDLSLAMRTDPLALIRGVSDDIRSLCDDDIRSGNEVCFP